MAVLVFGSSRIAQKLAPSLNGSGDDVVSTTDVPEMIALLEGEKFTLAIVDSQEEKAEKACHHISELCDIPLVLLVKEKQTDWTRLESLDVDGYLPEGVRKVERVARIRAIVRRHSVADVRRQSNYHN